MLEPFEWLQCGSFERPWSFGCDTLARFLTALQKDPRNLCVSGCLILRVQKATLWMLSPIRINGILRQILEPSNQNAIAACPRSCLDDFSPQSPHWMRTPESKPTIQHTTSESHVQDSTRFSPKNMSKLSPCRSPNLRCTGM